MVMSITENGKKIKNKVEEECNMRLVEHIMENGEMIKKRKNFLGFFSI